MKRNANQIWLGVFACFTVVWGLLSVAGLVLSLIVTPDMLAGHYSPEQVHYLLDTPIWALAGKAFTACGLLVGSVYLLLRRVSAYYWFMWSLMGTVMVMLDSFLRGGYEVLGGMETGVSLASVIVGIFIFWAAYSAVQDGQLEDDQLQGDPLQDAQLEAA